VRVILTVGDDVSTDEILPAGSEVLPLRSNIPAIAEHCFRHVDDGYVARAREEGGDHAIVAGDNYGQGSSREHAALAPRSLGLRVVLARSFARIHRANLIAFGVLPLELVDPDDAELGDGDVLVLDDARECLTDRGGLTFARTDGPSVRARHDLTDREISFVLAGGRIPWRRRQG
jgi:aconitate hydratase